MAYNSYDAAISYDQYGYNYDGESWPGPGKGEASKYRRIWLPERKNELESKLQEIKKAKELLSKLDSKADNDNLEIILHPFEENGELGLEQVENLLQFPNTLINLEKILENIRKLEEDYLEILTILLLADEA